MQANKKKKNFHKNTSTCKFSTDGKSLVWQKNKEVKFIIGKQGQHGSEPHN